MTPTAPPALLALDQGTSSTRALLFSGEGRILAGARREFPCRFPRPGWVEQDPEDLIRTSEECLREVLANPSLPRPAALGITNQRETLVLWDRKTLRAVHPAIVWQCRRSAEICLRLKERGKEDLFRARTGLVLDPYFTGTKITWILENRPDLADLARRGELAAGTVDSWLVARLTRGRVHATDESNASRTLLYDIRRHRWDEELAELLGIPLSLLPEVRDSTASFGDADLGLPGGPLPIHGVAGDQQAALFGQACFEPGEAKNTYGTGCFLMANTGPEAVESSAGLLTTVAWRHGGATTYALEGSVFTSGSAIQWLRDQMGFFVDAAGSERLASSVPDAGGVVVVPAFTGLGAPQWDPQARGAIFGLTRGSLPAHVTRATLEAIAHQSAELVFALEKDLGVPLRRLAVDGGATSNSLLMRIQADLLGKTVEIPEILETTALGAAFLAGVGAGVLGGFPDVKSLRRVSRRFEPEIPEEERMKRRKRYGLAVAACRSFPGQDA